VEDLIHGLPVLRLPAAGEYLRFSPSQRLLGFHAWGFDEIRTYEWRPSPVLRGFHSVSDTTMGSLFSPDERWLCTFNQTGYYWWSLDPLRLDKPARTDEAPGAASLFFQKAETPEVVLVSPGVATIYTFTGTADGPSLLTNPRPAAWKQEDLPELLKSQIEAITASRDGRVVAIGGFGPVGVWRDGKLWRTRRVLDPQNRGDAVRLSLSPDARLLAVGSWHARRAWVWDLEDTKDKWAPLHEEKFANGAVVEFSPDGRWLACSGDDEIRVLETASWKVVAHWPREVRYMGLTHFSADSKLLFIQHTAEDITMIRTGTWEELLRLQSPTLQPLTAFALSPSGRWLAAAAGHEGAHWLWDLHALERELRSMGLGW
jgi:WD40 repeat protein